MTYNLTNLTASNNLLDYSIAVNNIVGTMLFSFSLVLIWIIVFAQLKNYESIDAAVTASFIVFVLAAILFSVGLVVSSIAVTCFVVLLVSMGFKMMS